ncbi:MAG: AN1-type zinc finger domain-containing protein [Candidatus Hodarchaeota archaeon]
MNNLTQQEQLATFLGIVILIITLIELLALPPENNLRLLSLGISTICISILFIFIFILQPMKGRYGGTSLFNRYSTPSSQSFSPTIIPPSKQVKKTVMRGTCHFCGESALMGFTCSYCNEYYCPEHRLPEKHDCHGILNQ